MDPIRILTNRASGKPEMNWHQLHRRGADVTIVHRNKLGVPGINEIYAETAAQMTDAVLAELDKGYDLLMFWLQLQTIQLMQASRK
ncbi:MAG: phosphopantothenoylcysteine decarboxylase [Methanolobus sp.]